MTIDFYWFSGTGNTSAIVRTMVEEFRATGIEVSPKRLEQGYSQAPTKKVAGNEVVIGLAFPANSKAVSPFIWHFLKSLPKAHGTKAFMVATCNDSMDVAGPLQKLLAAKGYATMGSCCISMPGNMALKGFDPSQDARLELGIAKAREFASQIADGTARWESAMGGPRALSALSRHTSLPWVSQRMLFKLKTDTDRCVACGLCARGCPVGNIAAERLYRHGANCQFCFRCMASCPHQAIGVKGRDDVVVRRTPVTLHAE